MPSVPREIDISSNTWFCCMMSRYCPGEGQSCGMPRPGERSHSPARRSGLGYGNGLSSSPSATLNTAVLAPIPMASESTITMVEPGLLASSRSA